MKKLDALLTCPCCNESSSLEDIEKHTITKALKKHINRETAARILKWSERSLYRKMKFYGIKVPGMKPFFVKGTTYRKLEPKKYTPQRVTLRCKLCKDQVINWVQVVANRKNGETINRHICCGQTMKIVFVHPVE